MANLRDLRLSPNRTLPERLLSVSFSRSGGPGGQNVNKVASKVDLRLDLGGAEEILGEAAVRRIRRQLENRIDGEGNLQVVSSVHREQHRNVEAALSRMENFLREALRPRRRRKRTRPSRASKERRLRRKKHRGRIKELRQDPDA